MTRVQLYGGGIDSHCIAHIVQPDVKVYFHLGTEEADREADVALRAGAIVDHRLYLADQVLPNKILPARNLLLVAMAAYYGNTIYIGSTAGDTTRDKDATFCKLTEDVLDHILAHDPGKALACHAAGLSVVAPALHLTKTELVRLYLSKGGDPAALLASRSCYHDGKLECGVCRSCTRKFVALRLNGLHPVFAEEPDVAAALEYARARNRGAETLELERLMQS